MTLRKRAEEILQLVRKTEDEIMLLDDTVTGNIYIGAGETDAVRILTSAANQLQKDYPKICFHISSGDAIDVIEQLNKGLLDFGVLFESTDLSEYNHLRIPSKDEWGVLMRRDALLAKKEVITPYDLWDKPLIISRQAANKNRRLFEWLKNSLQKFRSFYRNKPILCSLLSF